MLLEHERQKSLQELEGDDWGEPTYQSSLVVNCHGLRRVPLQQLTPSDCRLLLGQGIGVPFLVPLALEWLRLNPLLTATFYPGDLLGCVLGLDDKLWAAHPNLFWEVREVLLEVDSMRDALKHIEPSEAAFVKSVPDAT